MRYALLFLFISFGAWSQPTSRVESFANIAGQPFFPKTYVDVEGTPFMFDDFQLSTITLEGGKILKDIRTNFNLVTNELLYVDENGKTMIASPKVIKQVDTGTRKFVTTAAKNSYFEVLTDGKAKLFKHYRKVVMETKAFNSATVQKTFVTNEDYMVAAGENLREVKSLNDIYEVLAPAGQLKDFAKKEKLKQKSASSWMKIVNYYNSI